MYSAAPSLLERVVPASTSSKFGHEAFDLMGFALPPGTVVATQAWTMHRNSAVFPSPETFLPDRWLDASPDSLALMTQHLMPFGTGTRMCGGQNLAHAMMRVVVAAIVRNFNIVAPPETNERSMEIKDSFVSNFGYFCTYRYLSCDYRLYFPQRMSANSYSTREHPDRATTAFRPHPAQLSISLFLVVWFFRHLVFVVIAIDIVSRSPRLSPLSWFGFGRFTSLTSIANVG